MLGVLSPVYMLPMVTSCVDAEHTVLHLHAQTHPSHAGPSDVCRHELGTADGRAPVCCLQPCTHPTAGVTARLDTSCPGAQVLPNATHRGGRQFLDKYDAGEVQPVRAPLGTLLDVDHLVAWGAARSAVFHKVLRDL